MSFVCHTDTAFAEGSICKWDKTRITLGIVPDNWPVQGDALLALIRKSVKPWEDNSSVRFNVVLIPADHDVNMPVLRIDGPGGVLAWSELPCGEDRRLQQRYDIRENWTLEWDDAGSGVSLPQTICHEVGHALGLPHGPRGNCMYYSSGGWPGEKLGPWDIAEIRKRYPVGPQPEPEKPSMEKLWPCILKGVVAFFECFTKAEITAQSRGEKGPLSALKVLAGIGCPEPGDGQNGPTKP